MTEHAAAVASTRPRSLSGFDAWCDRTSERFDAVLVKDMRQAVRSLFFRTIFILALVLTTLGGLAVLVVAALNEDWGDTRGAVLFGVAFACASLGAIGLVPFAAFASMNAESDEDAIDLVSLTRLTPMSIVRGKLVVACVQTLLVYSVCLPYLVVAWSLGGIGPSFVAGSIGIGVALSATLSAVGIAMSSLTRIRWLRIVLMVVFGYIVFNAGPSVLFVYAFGLAGSVFGRGAGIAGALMAGGAVWLVACTSIVIAFAAERLAHRETSTSTPLRIAVSAVAVLLALCDVACAFLADTETALVVFSGGLALLAAPLAWLVTEREPLPLAVRVSPPIRGWRGVLAIPHVAGGGRGALLATLTIAPLCVVHFVACAFAGGKFGGDALRGVVLGVFTWAYLLFISGMFAPFSAHKAVPWVARAAIVVLPIVGSVFASIAGIFAPSLQILELLRPGVFSRSVSSGAVELWTWAFFALGIVGVLALNAWRMFRGVREVLNAQREHARIVASHVNTGSTP